MEVLFRICLLAGLCVGLAAPKAALADELTSAVTLGHITFNYSPRSWSIEPRNDGLVATCLQEDCRGAVVDITRREGEALCTKEDVALQAARLFPMDGRFFANVLQIGRFALALAERHDGPELSSPEFAYGCLVWQGYEYRFSMRPETVGTQSWIGGAVAYLVSRATAPETPDQLVRIGDVTFAVSTEQWRIAREERDGTIWLECRMPTCGTPDLRATITASQPAAACPPSFLRSDLEYEGGVAVGTILKEVPGGLDFTTATFRLGCRNYVAPRFAACTTYNGHSYHLSTEGSISCQGSIWEIPESTLTNLLRSARIVQ